MPIISVSNHKGGSGKTTSVLHVGTALGMLGHRVLVVDLDPQGFLTRMLGVSEPPENESVLRLFGLDASIEAAPKRKMLHFDLIPSSTTMTKMMRRMNKPIDVLWLREALKKGHDYDYVLLDTAAAITVFSLNALVASEFVLIPVMPEYQPVEGAEQTYRSCLMVKESLNQEMKNVFFVLTSVDARKNTHMQYRAYLRRRYGTLVFDQIVRTSASLAQQSAGGVTVYERDMTSRGALDYVNVTDELLRRIKPLHLRQPSGDGAV